MTTRECPICNYRYSTLLFSLKYFFPDDYGTSAKRGIVICDNCCFAFSTYESEYASLDEYAKECNRYEGVQEGFYGHALKYIKDNVKKDAAVLDVGCGQGFLLQELKNEGYTCLYGLDPSKYCVDKLNENGLNGRHGSVYDSIPGYKNSFDVIVFTNVIEHIDKPGEALKYASMVKRRRNTLYRMP